MEKGLIIAGKDFPYCSAFVRTALAGGFSVGVSLAEDGQNQTMPESVHGFVLQRKTALAARSFVLEAQTSLTALTHALLIFDAQLYAKTTDIKDTQMLSDGIDRLICSYMYVTHEIISRFIKLGGGTLCFAFNPLANDGSYIKSASRFADDAPASLSLVSAAAAAFKSFAEQTAAQYRFSPVKFCLVEYVSAFTEEAETQTAEYIFSLPDMLCAAKTTKDSSAKAARWIRAGSKFAAVKNIFGR